MTAIQASRRLAASPLPWSGRRPVASPECVLDEGVCPVTALRAALLREQALLREKDELIRPQAVLSDESDHRLLNNLQMVASLLSMQARASANADVTSALTLAANRVAMIGRIHRHLHSVDRIQSVAFKQYLEELCQDFTAMLAMQEHPARTIFIEGVDLQLPTSIAIPLGFVVNELITNALNMARARLLCG